MAEDQEQVVSITILIAGRPIPLRIAAEEETTVRRTIRELNNTVNDFQNKYPDRDKQDCLAMAALTYAVELSKVRQATSAGDGSPVAQKLGELETLVDRLLAE
jgi:cell division protein ZapA (FtsZ GTPase activity inhibitor)